ncbi:MAG: hypothetical protein H6R10_2415 [Rhodocyclaceae bacterium]|nr:hypothetical protein [Rhodocyclaceae bacterium]
MVLGLLRRVWCLAVLAAMLGPLSAAADPPARVGRLSLTEGTVTFRINGQDADSPAAYNWPISSGAILATGDDGRAEVQIGSSAFRLAGDSQVDFTTVDDQRIAVQVQQGSLAVTVRDRDQADDIEIGTAAGRIQFDGPGRYRVDFDQGTGDTRVSSREGSAHVYRAGSGVTVPAGQQAVLYSDGGWGFDDLRPDAFDAWADARDAAGSAPLARHYVSPQMTGYEDLDAYGDWGAVADYGTVWYPRSVPVDWAPYRYGRWAWVPPWGWTWVDAAPWGFAPFHYGRWLFIGNRWAWLPGTYVARPVYAPALVAWIGSPGWSISFGFGSAPAVGWFPLAPQEVFLPAYSASPAYVRRINHAHVHRAAVIDQALHDPRHHQPFLNRRVAPAVTVVPATAVRSGRPITPALARPPDRRQLAQAPVSSRAPGTAWLPPARQALRPRPEAFRTQPGQFTARPGGGRPPNGGFGSGQPAPVQRPPGTVPGAPVVGAATPALPRPADASPHGPRREDRRLPMQTLPVPPQGPRQPTHLPSQGVPVHPSSRTVEVLRPQPAQPRPGPPGAVSNPMPHNPRVESRESSRPHPGQAVIVPSPAGLPPPVHRNASEWRGQHPRGPAGIPGRMEVPAPPPVMAVPPTPPRPAMEAPRGQPPAGAPRDARPGGHGHGQPGPGR